MSAATTHVPARSDSARGQVLRRHGWTIGLFGLLVARLACTQMINPDYGVAGFQSLAIAVLPLALATVGQAIVIISGGIFFFLAEDGIRGADVTGVQTCALPISAASAPLQACRTSKFICFLKG